MANEPSLAIGPSDVGVANTGSVVDNARSGDSHAVPATLSFSDTTARSTVDTSLVDTSLVDSASSIPAASTSSGALGTRRHDTFGTPPSSAASTIDVGVTGPESRAIGQVVTGHEERPTFGPVKPVIPTRPDNAAIRRQINERNGAVTTETLRALISNPDGSPESVVMTQLAQLAGALGMGLAADGVRDGSSRGFEVIEDGPLVRRIQRVEANPDRLAASLGRSPDTGRGEPTGRSSGLGGIAG